MSFTFFSLLSAAKLLAIAFKICYNITKLDKIRKLAAPPLIEAFNKKFLAIHRARRDSR